MQTLFFGKKLVLTAALAALCLNVGGNSVAAESTTSGGASGADTSVGSGVRYMLHLHTRSSVTGVAKNSQHMQAKAIDIRIPGVATKALRDAALSLHEGGVGYYPISQFVHVDVGPVRQWAFAGRGE